MFILQFVGDFVFKTDLIKHTLNNERSSKNIMNM